MSVSQRSRVNSGAQIKKKREKRRLDSQKAGEVASVKAEEQDEDCCSPQCSDVKEKKKEDNNEKTSLVYMTIHAQLGQEQQQQQG